MPFDRNSDLPTAVRTALPGDAQTVFREAFNGAVKRGANEGSAFAQAWTAVRNGWKKSGDHWVRKEHQPSEAETHVDAPVGERKPKRRQKKPPASEVQMRKPEGELVELNFAVAKNAEDVPIVDEDQRLVFGWLSVIEENGEAVVDLQEHVILPDDLEKAAYEFVIEARGAGEMHERLGVGKLAESMVFTKAKQDLLGVDLGKVGWWVGFRVDPDVFDKVKSGEYRAFSIGGRGLLEDMPEAA